MLPIVDPKMSDDPPAKLVLPPKSVETSDDRDDRSAGDSSGETASFRTIHLSSVPTTGARGDNCCLGARLSRRLGFGSLYRLGNLSSVRYALTTFSRMSFLGP